MRVYPSPSTPEIGVISVDGAQMSEEADTSPRDAGADEFGGVEVEQVLAYCRVSTSDQNLSRQVRSVLNYSRRRFDVELGSASIDDVAEHVEAIGGGDPVEVGDVTIYHDKSTGTDTSRAGYKDMMEHAENGDPDAVVTHSVSRISRSISDLDRAATRLDDAGVMLHIKSEGLVIRPDDDDPYTRAMFNLLGTFAQLEADLAQARTREGLEARRLADDEYHHGRPPLGFTKEDGNLYEQSEGPQAYHRVVSVLESVAIGELSKRAAADELNTSRATIRNAIEDRAELYGL